MNRRQKKKKRGLYKKMASVVPQNTLRSVSGYAAANELLPSLPALIVVAYLKANDEAI
jgi:hypothetical protein